MKFQRLYPILVALVILACSGSGDYDPSHYLTVQQQDMTMSRIIRYGGRLPDGVPIEDRLNKAHTEHYLEQMSLHSFDMFYPDVEKRNYFLISRRAPSLKDKRVAIGGYFKLDDKDSMVEYEEVFRTWSMPPDTLKQRSMILFGKMIRREDLTAYYSAKSGRTDFIEFPDEKVYYDKATRTWRTK